MERDYIRESMKFGDIGDSSYSDQERNEGKSISVEVEINNSLLGRFEWGCCMHCYHIKFKISVKISVKFSSISHQQAKLDLTNPYKTKSLVSRTFFCS